MRLSTSELQTLCSLAQTAASRAGFLISETPFDQLSVERKPGGDTEASQVVSQLDRDAQAIILETLESSIQSFDFAILAEEHEDDHGRLEKAAFWCIDPLDGTLPFLEGKAGYAVSIALVSSAGVPLIGVVHDPRTGTVYSSVRGMGAQRAGRAISSPERTDHLHLFSDRSLTKDPLYPQLLAGLDAIAHELGLRGVHHQPSAGAVMNACGILDQAPACYLKFPKVEAGGGSLWDYAATACIFSETSACVSDIHGHPLDLNRHDSTFLNHCGILYASDRNLHRVLLDLADRLAPEQP